MNRLLLFLVCGILGGQFATPAVAERFDDITVAPQAVPAGQTYHGYCEFRVVLENHSPQDSHRVTLVFPDQSYNWGNSIRSISRTVALSPNSRSVVPLWQPPLPANGNSQIRVVVDGRTVGSVNLPNGHQHLNRARYSYSGGVAPVTVLVSRSLDFDALSRAMRGSRMPFAAEMATGPADSRTRGVSPASWMPDYTRSGPHWLELDYDPPIPVQSVRIYDTTSSRINGELILTGSSGTNLARLPITPTTSRSGSATFGEFACPLTPEPVKTVRLEFPSVSYNSVGIDAVELVGPSGSAWAAAARASSDAGSVMAGHVPGGSGFEPRQFLRAELPVGEWSESWLAYSAYDAIALSAVDFGNLPPAIAAALWRYAEAGGNLFLFGNVAVPKPWALLKAVKIEGGRQLEIGFGRCFLLNHEKAAGLTTEAIKAMLDSATESAQYWQSLPNEDSANHIFPVVADFQIPVRGTVLIMLGFVLLIGPVNLIVLARLKRRVWMLWTIPGISAATCLTVFAYSLAREGVTPDVRLEGVTLLDQANRRATSIGATAFYCPLTPNQGLQFGFETEVTPLVGTDYRGGTQRELDWTQSQHLRRGWVTARVPAHFHLRKSETCRERLQVEREGDDWSVVNGLGARIKSLWFADVSGKVFIADSVGAGEKVNLSRSPESPNLREQAGARALFARVNYGGQAAQLAGKEISFLLPGTYIAELEGSPFLDNGLGPSVKKARVNTRTFVYGILESTPAS